MEDDNTRKIIDQRVKGPNTIDLAEKSNREIKSRWQSNKKRESVHIISWFVVFPAACNIVFVLPYRFLFL
jgi:hypothetical protein